MELEQQLSSDLLEGLAPEMRSATMQAEIVGDKFVGYAAVYDQVADLGDFTEESARGSFRKILSQQRTPVPFYYDHIEIHGPIAHTGGDKTLRLAEDTRGLHVEVPKLPQHHPQVAMLREQIERGEVRHMSYGFIAGRGNSRVEERGGRPHRVLTGYNALLDVSPTWRPAYTGTTAELRHALLGMIPDLSQQADGGAHQQPDGGAAKDTDIDADAVQHDEAVAESEEQEEQEQRSGADQAAAESAARRRRLLMMGLTLPR